MNREILFRGKRIDNNEWVQGYLFKIWEDVFILWGTTNGVPNSTQVDPKTIGQFTGLLDKNGVKIFEGDIVSGKSWGQQFVLPVEWTGGGFAPFANSNIKHGINLTSSECEIVSTTENQTVLKIEMEKK